MERESPYVLVIDDEVDLCWALENSLRSSGYTVVTATNRVEALEQLNRHHYVVAFVDTKLPDLDGLAFAALIRQQNPRTSVVLISGYYYQEDETITEGLQKGLFIDFIAKPFNLNEVRLLTRQAVEREEA
jgi:DNA-binding NtrC family response regulator